MIKIWKPVFETITVEPKPQKPRIAQDAVTNFPPDGTRVKCELQGWSVTGLIRGSSAEYGVFYLEHKVWIDSHFRGEIEIRISPKLGWNIEILEEVKPKTERPYGGYDSGRSHP